ncbi:C39 family peptidase [Rummeliibacillus sp. JY-2-4R]
MKKTRIIVMVISGLFFTEGILSGANAKAANSALQTNVSKHENSNLKQSVLDNTPAIIEKNRDFENLITHTPISATAENSTTGEPKIDSETDEEIVNPNDTDQTPTNEPEKQPEPPKMPEPTKKPEPPKKPTKPKHVYAKKTNEQKLNFYLKIKTNQKKNYPIYKFNPYNVDSKSLKPSHRSFNYKGKEMYVSRSAKVSGKLWYRISYKGKLLGWIEANGLSSTYKNLNVKVINQNPELPTGCEITAVTMMLQYSGANVYKMQMAKEMPKTHTLNGNLGFVGSPYSKTGWWIFPPALMKLVKKHAGSSINMTRKSLTSIKKQINRNHPVIVWVANVDGFVNHALTITGYSSTRVYFNDPWTGKKSSMAIKTFMKHWKDDQYRAISY